MRTSPLTSSSRSMTAAIRASFKVEDGDSERPSCAGSRRVLRLDSIQTREGAPSCDLLNLTITVQEPHRPAGRRKSTPLQLVGASGSFPSSKLPLRAGDV